jgi:hypothetical protein
MYAPRKKSPRHAETPQLDLVRSRSGLSALNLPAFKAGSANVHLLCAAFGLDANGLNVRFPDSVRSSMRMADIVAEMNILTADTAFCHFNTSPEWISILDGTQFLRSQR